MRWAGGAEAYTSSDGIGVLASHMATLPARESPVMRVRARATNTHRHFRSASGGSPSSVSSTFPSRKSAFKLT